MRPRKIFSLHSHQTIIRKSIYTLYFYGRLYEKDYGVILLALTSIALANVSYVKAIPTIFLSQSLVEFDGNVDGLFHHPKLE